MQLNGGGGVRLITANEMNDIKLYFNHNKATKQTEIKALLVFVSTLNNYKNNDNDNFFI